jgi:hypothetical protein
LPHDESIEKILKTIHWGDKICIADIDFSDIPSNQNQHNASFPVNLYKIIGRFLKWDNQTNKNNNDRRKTPKDEEYDSWQNFRDQFKSGNKLTNRWKKIVTYFRKFTIRLYSKTEVLIQKGNIRQPRTRVIIPFQILNDVIEIVLQIGSFTETIETGMVKHRDRFCER